MKKILFVLSFLCTAFIINAQQVSIQGIVADSTGTPIPNVQIIISNSLFGNPQPVGGTITDANGSYFWLDTINGIPINGPGVVDVTMVDCNNGFVNQSLSYTPNNISLTANFVYCIGGSNTGSGSCSVTSSSYNDTINPMTEHFMAQPTGVAPYTYSWDFGDGNTSSVASPTHTYTQNGTYTACVAVIDANGCVATSCSPVSIGTGGGSGSCFLNIGLPNVSGNTISASVNLSGSGNISYYWNMGDGTTYTTSTINHTYAQAGTYWIYVEGINSTTNCGDSISVPITIGSGGGNCQALMNYLPDSMNPMTNYFDVMVNGGAGPYTYSWDFGDGNTSTAVSPTHTYAQSGTYTVCVTVTDANGCISTDCQPVFAHPNTPCNTSFTATPSVANPNTYIFTSANTGNNNTLYFWDFGDGGIDTLSQGTTTYTYAQAGVYMACLYEINLMTGCLATYCDTVIVGGGAACQAFITYNNNPGSLVVDFFGTVTTNNNPVTYAWDFGDGNTSTVQNPTHTYQTGATGPVSYNVTLITTDANGCTAVATETVFVFGGTGNGQIIGYMWKDTSNFIPADGLVYLIEYDSIAGTLTAIDTVTTQQGFFDFQNVPMGLYLVKGALLPTDPDYANYMPTYFIQSLNWANGQYVSPTPFGIPAFIDIQLIAGNNPGGSGFIGGLVVNGAGRPVNNGVTTVKDITTMIPMEGVSVLLLDANNNAVTHTVTDVDGSYSFSNLAMGTYNVHVEEVGKVTFPANILIDANNMNHSGIHFTIHDNMVTLTGTYAVSNVEDLQIFPNPVYNTANIQLALKASMNLTMTVTNLMGQEFINQPFNLNAGDHSLQVEMSDLPAGLYMVSLKSETDVITYKIQKL